jgi:D-alanine-D-alanine ligase
MKVLLLAGGASNEREVSLTSGEAVLEALQRLGHEVQAIDPATGKSLLGSNGRFITSGASDSTQDVVATKTNSPALAKALSSSRFEDVDVVFVALHGGAGENGAIQCLLELAGKAFTGSDMTASAVAMDKAIAKRLFASAKIPTPDWELYRFASSDIDDRLMEKICRRFPFPIIVKPNDSGSTIGLSRVEKEAGLIPALRTAIKESRNVLIEKYIAGRELTVAVLDGQALPVVEIKAASGLYDYEAKYTKGKSEYVVPADVDTKTSKSIQEAAVKAYDIIGAAGLVRVDFILADNGEFYCLEVNTVPGMTSLSLAPMAAQAVGIGFDDLISRLIASALDRHNSRSDFDPPKAGKNPTSLSG